VLGYFGRELGIAKFVDGIMNDLRRRSSLPLSDPTRAAAQEEPSWNGPGLFFEVENDGGGSPMPATPAPAGGANPEPAGGKAAVIK
jgi:hypothetical protein